MSPELLAMIRRGRETLEAYFQTLPEIDRPRGALGMDVVLYQDFLENIDLCMERVRVSGRVLHVLNTKNTAIGWHVARTSNNEEVHAAIQK